MDFNRKYNYDEFKRFIEQSFRKSLNPVKLELETRDDKLKRAYDLGIMEIDEIYKLAFVEFEVRDDIDLEFNRVYLSKSAYKSIKNTDIDGAIAIFFNQTKDIYRLSFVNNLSDKSPDFKRFSFTLGRASRTASEQLLKLKNIRDIDDIEEIFSVEPLNQAFFKDYKELFENLNEYLKESNFSNFQRDEKNIRDFSKKLLGRIVFLYFLQKKGWLGSKESWGDGDRDFLNNSFKSLNFHNFYEDILKPIFFEALNTQRDEDFFELTDSKVPFLNGGLFERKEFDSEFLSIDNSIFENIFTTFNRYNFTIIEDTLSDSEVAIDPEMLGRVFENLLEENYRSGKGAFYTPREIVHYMAKESIKNYLNSHSLEDKLKLLKSIKVLDPAIGSGAFPMGILLELIQLREQLGDTTELAKLKRDIIENSIYGVDIDSSAVDIAKLRFWLSLVVDESEPLPLPNLQYKIMQGNSLVESINSIDPMPIGESAKYELFNVENLKSKDKIDILTQKLHKFYSADSTEQKSELKSEILNLVNLILDDRVSELRDDISNIKSEIEINLQKNLTKAISKKIEQLRERAENIEITIKEIEKLKQNPISDKLFLYKLWFGEVIKEGGFDIVIGNPPYIMEDENKKAFDGIHKFECYQGKTDIWHLFTCKGIELLKDNGIISYIAKNQWLNSSSASKMRKSIYSNTELKYIIDFGSNLMFENADVQTMIFLAQKNNQNKTHKINYYKFEKQNIKNIKLSLKTKKIDFILKEVIKDFDEKDNLTFSSKENELILAKVDNMKNFEFDEKKEVIQGIIGGPDKAFIVKENELNNFNENEKEYLKMLHTNTKKFFTPNSNQYIFYLSKKNFDDKDINDYPNIKSFFEPNKKILESAKIKYKTPNKLYFYLHRERDENFFKEGDKIVFSARTKSSNFTFTNQPFYGSRNLFFIKSNRVNLKYITALLNSKLFYFYMKERLKHTGDLLQIDKNQFMKVPLYVSKDIRAFENLVDEIMELKEKNQDTSELEAKIDKMVYELYGLSENEIRVVEAKL